MKVKNSLFPIIKEDINFHGGTSLISVCKIFFFDASFRLVLNYRIGHYLFNSKNRFFKVLCNYYRYKLITKRSCDISYKAKIGKRIKFPHPLSIVIGDNVKILDNVKIWQDVTIGSSGSEEKLYPTIGNGCKIYPGSIIIGPIILGENVTIGANSFVNESIPDNKIAIGSPARIIR